jgi:anti-anti-sigma factor
MPRTRKKKSDPDSAVAEMAPAVAAPDAAVAKEAPVEAAAPAAPAEDDLDALFEQLYEEKKSKPVSAAEAPAEVSGSGAVALEGELTIDRVAQVKTSLQQALAAAKSKSAPLLLDLTAVTECDGAGLQLLLALAQSAHAASARIELQGTPPKIAALFDSFGVAGHFKAATRGVAQ